MARNRGAGGSFRFPMDEKIPCFSVARRCRYGEFRYIFLRLFRASQQDGREDSTVSVQVLVK